MGIAKIRHLRSKIRRMGASCTNIIGMRLKNRERADLARSEVNRSDATQEPAFGVGRRCSCPGIRARSEPKHDSP